MQSILGQSEVNIQNQKWTFLDADPPLSLRRIIGPQAYMITALGETSTFWITGGINFFGPGYEVPYQQSSILPPAVSCSVLQIPGVPKSVFKDVFQVTTTLGAILVFRFSPTQAFPPTVEVGGGSSLFGSLTISVLAINPANDQNTRSSNGYYPRFVESTEFSFSAVQVNPTIPIPLRRVIGVQLWNFEITSGGTTTNGGRFIVTYGNKRDTQGFIGTISALAVARILFIDGPISIIAQPLAPNSGIQYDLTYRLTLALTAFDLWFSPESYPPTVRLVGPPLVGTSLVIRIQKVNFN